MPKSRDNTQSLRALVDTFAQGLTQVLSAQIERQVVAAVALLQKSGKVYRGDGKVDGRRGGRLCPVPGCGEPALARATAGSARTTHRSSR